MSSRSLLAILHISFAVILITFLFAFGAQAQVSVTFQGRVMYSTGTPAAGAQVTMTRTENGSSSITTTSGCVGPGTVGLGNLIIVRPHEITLGGVVRDQFGTPVQGLTVTMTRTKYDLNPNVVTTAATTTDGNGHYQFSTFSRCSVDYDFRASIGGYTFQGGTATGGCVTESNDFKNFTINLGTLENAGGGSCNKTVGRPVNVTNGNVYLQQNKWRVCLAVAGPASMTKR